MGYGSATALRTFLDAATEHTDWQVVTVRPGSRDGSGRDDVGVVPVAAGHARLTQLVVFPLRAMVIALGGTARDADVVISWQPLPTAVAGHLAARRHGLPHVVRTCGPELHRRWSRYHLLSVLARPLTAWLLRSADAVVVKSRLELSLLPQQVHPHRVHLVPNAVVRRTQVRPIAADQPVPATPRLLAVAQLEIHKGVDRLIHAVAATGRKHAGGLPLTVAGHGSQRLRLEALALRSGAEVTFVGRVPTENMAAVYRGHDVLVVASEMEGCSNAVLEAMAAGLPIVGPRAALDGLVLDGYNGVVAERTDTAALAAAIHRFVHLRAEWEQMRDAARTVAEQHRPEVLVHAYDQLLTALAPAGST